MSSGKMSIEQAIRLLHPETTAEAIAEIKYYGGFHGRTACIDALYEASLVACEAMEKQIPKKPYKNNDYQYCNIHCPTCHKGLFLTDHHCRCGQAIDWSDYE